ncbi:YVTN family beta-propeller repeat protein [Pseudoduganella chitinolytica]|uniref:Cytochrome D1 domain-containing protein n=1 Tax=Pseudoduganella chitinolytica TaxID=34070 RepID=A0ABY8B5S9_9BURK|nr:cytochrome D1 domain-containing protein [Pseudoduganella chitinolytica]WEF30788.1 cytochrome D1 domain-containing protein [Pseudoduganella chitinolytica]
MSRIFRRVLLSASLLAACHAAQANVPPSGNGNVVVVLNSRDATVQLLDQGSYKSLQTFAVGKEPHHLMATPDNKSLIVASSVGNELLFLDPKSGQVQRRIKDIVDPYQIGFTPDQKWFVATALRLDRVDLYKYNGRDFTLAKRLPMAKLPSHIAFDAHSTMAFITQQGSDQVSAIDLATQAVKWTIPVGKLPAGIAMTPDDKYLLVGIMGSDYVEVIDWRTQKTVKRIKAGAGTHNFRAQGDSRYTYVSNRVSNSINIIDQKTLTNVGQINVPGGPDCMEITADGKTMWVTLRWIKKVAVIDLPTRKVVKYIPVGRSPHGVFFANSSARM